MKAHRFFLYHLLPACQLPGASLWGRTCTNTEVHSKPTTLLSDIVHPPLSPWSPSAEMGLQGGEHDWFLGGCCFTESTVQSSFGADYRKSEGRAKPTALYDYSVNQDELAWRMAAHWGHSRIWITVTVGKFCLLLLFSFHRISCSYKSCISLSLLVWNN